MQKHWNNHKGETHLERMRKSLKLFCMLEENLGFGKHTRAYVLTGKQSRDLLVHERMLNLLSYTSWAQGRSFGRDIICWSDIPKKELINLFKCNSNMHSSFVYPHFLPNQVSIIGSHYWEIIVGKFCILDCQCQTTQEELSFKWNYMTKTDIQSIILY